MAEEKKPDYLSDNEGCGCFGFVYLVVTLLGGGGALNVTKDTQKTEYLLGFVKLVLIIAAITALLAISNPFFSSGKLRPTAGDSA